MAKKGLIFKSYTNEERIKIVQRYLNCESPPTMLSKEYNISVKTIWNWISKYKSKGYNLLDNRPKMSGNRKIENIDYKERYEILKKYQAFLKAQREKKVTFINLYTKQYKLSNMCAVLEISKNGYYFTILLD